MSTTPPIRRRLRPAQRRQVIIDAASAVLAQRGYGAATMADIAAAAGVTKPVLYRHFASKKDLHLALLAHHRGALAAGPLDEFSHRDDRLEDVLEPMLHAWFAYVEQHPYAWRLLLRDTTGDPEVEAFHEELRGRQRAADMAIMRESLEGWPDDELEPLAECVRSTLTGLALWWLDHPDVPRQRLVRTAVLALGGLLSAARAAR